MVRLERIVTMYKKFPRYTTAVATEFCTETFRFAQCQASLIHHFHPHTPLFNQTVKTHYLCHLGLMAKHINPSLGACWAGEDLMISVRRLVKSSLHGNTPLKGQFGPNVDPGRLVQAPPPKGRPGGDIYRQLHRYIPPEIFLHFQGATLFREITGEYTKI